jgi:hypothetical protein
MFAAFFWSAGVRAGFENASPASQRVAPKLGSYMEQRSRPTAAATSAVAIDEDEVAYLAKRHRISPAIVREIMRRTGSSERSAVEREIRKGMMRR